MINLRAPQNAQDYISLSNLAEKLALYHHEELRPNPEQLMADTDWFSARIASVDGKDIGYIGWHKLYECQSATRSLELQNLYVEPDFRGQHVGVLLVLEVARDGLKHGATVKNAVLKNNEAAFNFYKKLGFTTTEQPNYWRCRWSIQSMKDFVAWAEMF